MKTVLISMAAGGLAAALAMGQTAPRYTVAEIGTLGGSASIAFGVNDAGRVAGGANLRSENQHPFLSVVGGLLYDLGTPGGPNGNMAGPNNNDQVGGLAETALLDPNGEDFCGYGTHLECRGILWGGTMTVLPPLGGNNSEGLNLNNLGRVAGLAETSVKDSTCPAPQMMQFEAAVWDATGQVTALPPLAGDTVGYALGLNDNGLVVGGSGKCSEIQFLPFLWHAHRPGQLGGQKMNAAAAVNNRGQVVGGSLLSDNQTFRAYIWTKETGMQEMGALKGDTTATPSAINDSGQVSGTSCDSDGNCRAFLWQNGVMTDLNTLAPPDAPLYLLMANWINNSGTMVGLGVDMKTGDVRGYIATPCGKQSTAAWRQGGGTGQAEAAGERPKVVLPEKVREMLLRRLLLPRPTGDAR